MDDLRTILDGLKDKQLAFVMARVSSVSTAEALRTCGIGKSAYYDWPEDERKYLEDVAFRLQRESATRALMIIQDAAVQAAEVKVQGLKNRDDRIKQAASTEILDRNLGKPTQKLDANINSDTIMVTLKESDD